MCLDTAAQTKHNFSLSKTDFLLDGKPFQIISGEVHPARIPREYWRHRIQMTKAMGCNTIAAYIFWNYHEEKENVFNFKTGNRDIAEFIKICQQEDIGPQQRLYCPASWLKKGNNEIIVFDLLQEDAKPIKTFKTLE